LLGGAQVWNKDYTQWSSEEVNTVLTDSPWAKQMNVKVPIASQRGGRGNGGGYPGGGQGGGGGYPGGGGGYPGGGRGGGGIGYPGGGIGFPGGGMGGGGRRGNGGGRGQGPAETMTDVVVLRWASAMPIQHAMLRQRGPQDDDDKPAAPAENPKYYVVSISGLQLQASRNETDDYDLGGSDAGDKDKKNGDDQLRSRLMDAAQLLPKGQSSIAAQDVQLEGRHGSREIRFLFPKTFPLTANEKEVKFHFESRGVKIEHTFKLSDMMYRGQLAL